MTILRTFRLCKIILESWYLLLGTQVIFVLLCICFFMYFLILIFSPQTWHLYPYLCVYYCVKQFKDGHVQCVGNVSRKTRKSQDASTKNTVKDIKIQGICYKIHTFLGASWASVITPKDSLDLILWMNPLTNLNCFKKGFLG